MLRPLKSHSSNNKGIRGVVSGTFILFIANGQSNKGQNLHND